MSGDFSPTCLRGYMVASLLLCLPKLPPFLTNLGTFCAGTPPQQAPSSNKYTYHSPSPSSKLTPSVLDANDHPTPPKSRRLLPLARPPRHRQYRRLSRSARRAERKMVDRRWLYVTNSRAFISLLMLSSEHLTPEAGRYAVQSLWKKHTDFDLNQQGAAATPISPGAMASKPLPETSSIYP